MPEDTPQTVPTKVKVFFCLAWVALFIVSQLIELAFPHRGLGVATMVSASMLVPAFYKRYRMKHKIPSPFDRVKIETP